MNIYLNEKLSEYFDVPYNNNEETTTIHSSALLKQHPEWDAKHKQILSINRDLQLVGIGFGWWEIIEDEEECGCSDPGCPCSGNKRGGEIR